MRSVAFLRTGSGVASKVAPHDVRRRRVNVAVLVSQAKSSSQYSTTAVCFPAKRPEIGHAPELRYGL
jgi:hypothetical protein